MQMEAQKIVSDFKLLKAKARTYKYIVSIEYIHYPPNNFKYNKIGLLYWRTAKYC